MDSPPTLEQCPSQARFQVVVSRTVRQGLAALLVATVRAFDLKAQVALRVGFSVDWAFGDPEDSVLHRMAPFWLGSLHTFKAITVGSTPIVVLVSSKGSSS